MGAGPQFRARVGGRVAAWRARGAVRWHWRRRAGVCPPIGAGAHLALRRWLRRRAGVDVHLTPPAGFNRVTKLTAAYEVDEAFADLVDTALERTGEEVAREGDGFHRVQMKLYNLQQALAQTAGVDGLVAEAGCFRGLSAFVLCRTRAAETSGFRGAGVHLFDSFQGLSALASEDQVHDRRVPKGRVRRRAGMFSATEDEVRATLAEYPDVVLHRGWIPESLSGAPEGPYRFVHLDLDLHGPTLAALAFFHPRLAPGGVLVCDDEGSVRWPGVRIAMDDYCRSHGVRPFRLSTGQAILLGG